MQAQATDAASAPSDEGAAPGPCLIDGKAIAAQVREEVRVAVEELKARSGGAGPGLAVVLVGERKDSQTYVRNKKKACAEAGIESFGTDLPDTATEEEILAVVEGYNADPRVVRRARASALGATAPTPTPSLFTWRQNRAASPSDVF